MKTNWMIYGANGYSGELIAREAARRGLRPVLAGRNCEAVQALARELGCEARVFALGEPGSSSATAATARNLDGVQAVLHCAGPFSRTSRAMLDACIEARVHYLDITGEIDVFESVFARVDELKRAGIAALPGAGFDVVPTDCLAAQLKRDLPSASHLTLAFRAGGEASPGTFKTMLEGIAQGGRVRRAGKIVAVPVAARSREVDFEGDGRLRHAILAPWGDVATAFHSTGIPNIEVYIAGQRGSETPMRLAARILRSPRVRALADRAIARWVPGPNPAARERGRSLIWGEVYDERSGKRCERRLVVAEGYRFTTFSAIACAERIAAGELAPGAWTPSLAFGAEFVRSLGA